jgi:hypothetical protein
MAAAYKRLCTHPKADGSPCRNEAKTGMDVCSIHDPANKAKLAAAKRKGGESRGRPKVILPLKVLSPEAAKFAFAKARDVTAFLEDTIQQVRTGQLDHKVAQAIAALCNVLMKALNTSELERISLEIEELKVLAQQRHEEAAMQAVALCDGADDGSRDPRLDDFEVGTRECDGEPLGPGNREAPYGAPEESLNGVGPAAGSFDDLFR